MDLTPYLRWPLAGLMTVAVGVGLLVWWARKAQPADGEPLVARTDRLRRLDRFRVLVRRRAWRTGLESAALLVVLAGCALLVARPAEIRSEVTRPSRDLVLCLDASTSMHPYDAEVMRAVRRVVGGLRGDRIGLTIFNGATVTKFPLTDDRAFVDQALAEAQEAFTTGDQRYSRATLDIRASQVGDALVGCVRGFDRLAEDRARAVLVATDNQPIGPPAFTVGDAADEAVARDVVLHALVAEADDGGADGADAGDDRADARFAAAVERTGGTFSPLGDDAGVTSVVERIDALESRRLQEPPRAVVRDEPRVAVSLAAAGLLALLVLVLSEGRRRR